MFNILLQGGSLGRKADLAPSVFRFVLMLERDEVDLQASYTNPFKYLCRSDCGNFSIAYRNIVLGISW